VKRQAGMVSNGRIGKLPVLAGAARSIAIARSTPPASSARDLLRLADTGTARLAGLATAVGTTSTQNPPHCPWTLGRKIAVFLPKILFAYLCIHSYTLKKDPIWLLGGLLFPVPIMLRTTRS
jgi:hypothetical protein